MNLGDFARAVFSVKTYDSPDGVNCMDKLLFTTKTGAFLGSYFSIYEMMAISRPTSLPMMAGRMMHFTLPAAGVGAAFAGTTCLVGQMRGQDGPANHAIGGIAAGLVIGAKTQNWKMGMGWSLALAAAMSFYKLHRDEGYGFLKQPKNNTTLYNGHQTLPYYGAKIGYKEYKKPDYE